MKNWPNFVKIKFHVHKYKLLKIHSNCEHTSVALSSSDGFGSETISDLS